MSLALLIMLFSGARQDDQGRYTYLKNGETAYFSEDEEILFSFSRLSCDMPPESLAYAALSDRAIWEEDLREIPGLEDVIADRLRDLQLLGLMEAVEKTWKNYEE
jgi:mannitol-1-phosphate/altronate dehydrogenase